MDPTKGEKEMQDNVLQAITTGKVKMRSKWYFALQTTLLLVGSVILALFVIYIVGFMIFILRESGASLAPGLGLDGWYIFLRSLPWLLVLLSLIFILVLLVLVNHYPLVYHRPLLYSLLGVTIIAIVVGVLVAFTPFDASFLDYGNPPILGGYYANYGVGELTDVHRGEIIVLAANGFLMQGISGRTSTVLFGPGMPPLAAVGFHAGDFVVVFGDRDSQGFIQASAIEKAQ